MRSLLARLAAAGAALGAVGEGALAQADSGFTAAGDSAVQRAADSLELTPPQREAFYANVDTAVALVVAGDPGGGRAMVDSALSVVVRETARKLRFVRHARALFSDMFARRQNDPDRRPGSEEELWRSPVNVTSLIELYRDNPDASDHDIERAMAAVFRRP